MTSAEKNRVVVRAVVVSLVGILAAYALYLVREIILTLYISSLLAVGLSPAVRRIERSWLVAGRYRIPRWAAILLLYLGFIASVLIILSLIVPPLIDQVQQLAQALPDYANKLQKELVSRKLVTSRWQWSDLFANMEVQGLALTSVFGAVSSVVGALGTLLTVLLLPFYLLLESAQLHSWMLRVIKPENRRRVDRIMRAATTKVGAWLFGQLLLALLIGTSATIGFWLIGVPYFALLGLLAAVGELIPVIGPILAAIPAVILGWTVSPQTALIVAVYSWFQQVIENNFLVPRIMERQVGVSPVVIIVALLLGSTLLGFVGAILAVPTAAIVQVVIREHFEHEENSNASEK